MATMPPNLENVPREIRNNILEQLLLEQKEVYPYGYPAGCQCSHCHIKAPDLSIMRVNKTLNAEATEVRVFQPFLTLYDVSYAPK